VSGKVRQFHWELFPLVLCLTLFNYTLRFGKWHFYLRQIGVRDLPVRESARLFVGGFPLAVTPGKVGEVLKAVWIQQKTGIPTARGVAVVVAERISYGLVVLLLSTVGVIASPRYWPAFTAVLALLLHLPADTAAAATLLIRMATLCFGASLGLVGWFFSKDLLGMGALEKTEQG
jgi:uncharacterized membrane protein YbhN (UPF0104 family)